MQGQKVFFYSTASRPILEPTPPPIQWVPWALSLEVKRRGHEADHSHLLRGQEWWSYTSTPPYVFVT
jgi:hypothetical protein